uniref:Uncharacterized protein n=1 Tax=Marmota marmota marmota TaxID=9994 RepID=A0A8C5YM20_MARMA
MDDHAASREERVPVAIHQHALHHRLGQVAGPGAAAAHFPAGRLPSWLQAEARSLPPRPPRRGGGKMPEKLGKPSSQGTEEKCKATS